jgi:hypothetical protein
MVLAHTRGDMDRRLATAAFTERRAATRALASLRGLQDPAAWDVELGGGDEAPTLRVPVELIERYAYVPRLIADAGGVLDAGEVEARRPT